MKRQPIIMLTVIIVAALVVRLVPAFRCNALPEYSDMARYNIAALGLDVPEPLPPGYPLFLRAIYGVFGPRNYRAVFVIQSIISALTILVIFWIARRISSEKAGLVAAGIAALYPNFIVYNLTTLTETISITLVTVLAALLVASIGDRKKAVFAAAALFAGYLFKPAFLFFTPGIFLGIRKRLYFALTIVLLLVPWIAFSGSDKGYHRAARAMYKTYHPESDGNTYVNIWHTDLGDRDTSTMAYARRAWSYVTRNPWTTLETIYNKGTIVLSRGWDTFVLRPIVGTKRNMQFIMAYGYIPIMLLGFAGMARLYGEKNRILSLAAFSYILFIILIAIFKIRYRLLIEPIVIVYAALMIVWLVKNVRPPRPADKSVERSDFVSVFKNNLDLLGVILLAALALRVYFAIAYHAPPVGGEAAMFDRIAADGGIGDTTPPVYPLFLRAVFGIFGEYKYSAVYLIQGIFGSLSVLLFYGIAAHLFNRRAGLIAAAVAALYPGFILYNMTTLPNTFCILFVLLIMTLPFLRLDDARKTVLSALLAGLCVLLKPVLILLAPGMLLTLKRKKLFVLILMLTLVPFTLFNALRFKKIEPVYKPYSFGINAGIATESRDGWDACDRVYDHSTIFMRQPWDVSDESPTDDSRRSSTFIASYFFTIIMLLGLTGLLRLWKREHRQAMLPVLLYAALTVLFSRMENNYRLPLEPVYILYAAALLGGGNSRTE